MIKVNIPSSLTSHNTKEDVGRGGRKPYNFGFMFRMMNSACKMITQRDVRLEDWDTREIALEPLPTIHQLFKVIWEKEKTTSRPSLRNALLKLTWKNVIWAALFAFLTEMLFLSNVFLLPYFISYLYDLSTSYWLGIVYSVIILLTVVLGYICSIQTYLHSIITARRVVCAVFGVLYEGILRREGEVTSGEVVPYLINFSDEFLKQFVRVCFTLVALPKILVCLILLGVYLEVYVISTVLALLVGFGILVFWVVLLTKGAEEQNRYSKITGEMETEIFSNIKYIKSLGWELPFIEKLSKVKLPRIRDLIDHFRLFVDLLALTTDVVYIAEALLFMISLRYLSPITILTLFGIFGHLYLSYKYFMLPLYFVNVSSKNLEPIERILLKEEGFKENLSNEELGKVVFKNVTLAWKERVVLSDINFEIEPGQFFIVIGAFASGKSTLLSSLVNGHLVSKGSISIGGKIAYLSQPWIPHGTIRENITLSNQITNEQLYKEALSAVGLDEDLKYFPDGDMTTVTMGGQVLSGGQQQRIGIARALYSDYDIYVLDDCLSAVDVHVAKHIFQNGILQMLRKKRKTILMAMNQIEFLRFSDKIVILADHQLVEMDSYTNLLKKDHFTQFMKKHYPDFQKAIQEEEKEEDSPRDTAALFMDEATKFQPQEDIRTGGIPWERFWEIVSLGGAKKYMVSIVFNLCRSLLRFLALWVLNSLWVPALQMDDNSYIISFYETAFVCSYVLMISCNVIAIFLQVSHQKTVGSSVFNRVVSRLIHAKLDFYHKTRIGTVLDVLENDIRIILSWVCSSMSQLQEFMVFMVSALICSSISVPIFLPFLIIILVFYIPFQMKVNTGVIRVERILKSSKPPIFNHFKESIDGLHSIKSYHLEDKMMEKMYQVGENYVTAYMLKHSFTGWLLARVYSWGTLLTICLLGCVVIVRNFDFLMIDSGLLTLGLIVGLSNTYFFAPFTLAICDLSSEMTYTETIRSFFDIEQEEELKKGVIATSEIAKQKNPKSSSLFPQLSESLLDYVPLDENSEEENSSPLQKISKGGCSVRFNNVWVSYHKDEAVLKGISFEVVRGQKVGLVGRTGSGKSTILNTILRLQQIDNGQITLAEIPIQRFQLKTLRTSIISTIPQIPVIFKDTLRNNLDPFGHYTDEEILETLKLVHLKQFSASSLDNCIQGSKLSIGEKQLLCLARAILKKCPLVLLDEPTASLDLETAALVKQIIDECFQDSTVFFVAHHLNMVMNMDKIIVFNKGQIVEYDTVPNLLQNKGTFYEMVMATGEKTSAKLINMIKS